MLLLLIRRNIIGLLLLLLHDLWLLRWRTSIIVVVSVGVVVRRSFGSSSTGLNVVIRSLRLLSRRRRRWIRRWLVHNACTRFYIRDDTRVLLSTVSSAANGSKEKIIVLALAVGSGIPRMTLNYPCYAKAFKIYMVYFFVRL